jgi:hypothetical protein
MQETPQQYRQRMLSYIEGRDPLRLLAATPPTAQTPTETLHFANLA